MKLLLGLVVAVGVLWVAAVLVKQASKRPGGDGGADGGGEGEAVAPEGPPPYEAKGALLTDAELRFLAVLEPAVAAVFGNEARISFQAPVGAVVRVRRGLERGEGQKWRNKVDRKTFDFVVTDARTRVLACVELDDSSHGRADRRERDGFLERACAAAGLDPGVGVSEALYLRDPDGNGVELYWDRPEGEWPRDGEGGLAMYTRGLDLEGLVGDS